MSMSPPAIPKFLSLSSLALGAYDKGTIPYLKNHIWNCEAIHLNKNDHNDKNETTVYKAATANCAF